jgi:hypothetical protein
MQVLIKPLVSDFRQSLLKVRNSGNPEANNFSSGDKL